MRHVVRFTYNYMHFHKSFMRKAFHYFVLIIIFLSIYNIAHSFQITLTWDPNREQTLAGYKVYYGTESRNYIYIVDIGKYESVTISNLKPGRNYYFAVTAYDIYQMESAFSTEVFYKHDEKKPTPWIPLLLLND